MKDLTFLKTYIIDSADPHEVDDAISLEINDGDVKKVWIHISNPSSLFLLDSSIDLDARKKNSSLYLSDKYIPMLPRNIIDKANLEQNKVSNTISASIYFNENGSINKYEITEAIIDLAPTEENELIELKNILLKSINYRKSKGAIIFDSSTSKFKLNNGNIELKILDKTVSQKIISEAMILMGYVTSLYLIDNNLPAIYRSQKINCNPNEILEKLKDSDIKYILLKQYMGKSYITSKENKHESLGLSSYVQCTSPLRRYLDLIVQRQVYNKINNYPQINEDYISIVLDYSIKRQLEINNIYKNDKLKCLTLFFNLENKTYYKITFVRWINYKKNIALVYFQEYLLEILIILYVSIDIYCNKTYKVKFNKNNNNLLEFIY